MKTRPPPKRLAPPGFALRDRFERAAPAKTEKLRGAPLPDPGEGAVIDQMLLRALERSPAGPEAISLLRETARQLRAHGQDSATIAECLAMRLRSARRP